MNKITYAVISFTGSHYLITQDQEKKLSMINKNDNIDINGAIVRGSNIAEIIPIQEYYKQYPEKRPEQTPQPIKYLPKEKISAERHAKRIQAMKDGFLRSVSDKNNLTEYQQKIYDKMAQSYYNIINQGKIYAKS